MDVTIYTDGSCNGNPGPMDIGVVMRNAETQELLEQLCKTLDIGDQNLAEMCAISRGLSKARDVGAKKVSVFCDSLGVVKQITGEQPCYIERLVREVAQIRRQAAQFDDCTITHIYRDVHPDNQEANTLAQRASTRGHGRSGGAGRRARRLSCRR